MVFHLNIDNNLPQSSTSSCTDYFYDGCCSKSQNNCQIQYQNCQCRPCCINSVINDHTYSLLKKICRKVFRDYNRQKSREKYTIFDGGNSVNVRIHRSSFAEDGKCNSLQADSSLLTLGGTRRKYGKDRERKDDNISEKSGKGAGVRKNGEKGKSRKSYEAFDTKRDRKKKEQDHDEDEKHGKGQKGKGRGYGDDSDGTRRRGKGKGKGEEDNYYGFSKGEKGKGKKTENGDKRRADKSVKEISGRKKYGVIGDGDRNDGELLDDKISKKKSDKIKTKRGSEDNDYHSSQNMGKLGKSRSKTHDGDEESRTGTKGGKNKERGSNEDGTSIKDRDGGKIRVGLSRDEGKNSRDQGYQRNHSIDDRHKGDRYDSTRDMQNAAKSSRGQDQSKDIKKGGHKGDWFKSSKGDHSQDKADRERDHQDKGNRDVRYKSDRYSNTRDGHDGSKGSRYGEKQMKGSRVDGHKDDRYSSARNDHDTDLKSIIRKKKYVTDLPVISDLRTKVRKGHEVMPVRKSRIGTNGYRSNTPQEARSQRKICKHGLKQLTKGSKDRINERYGNRICAKMSSTPSPLGRAHFGTNRGYAIGISSRCDEIRPCDILRAHMEQRELCERQRSCCLQCSCDCSAVYCPVPSTLCSRLC